MAAKTGRNDPCPCGSGQKYKRCCLAKEAAGELPWQRLRQVDDAMVGKLLRYAQQRFGDEYLEIGLEEFHLWEEPPTDAQGAPIDHAGALGPWLLYCFAPDPDDDETPSAWPARPLAITYLEDRGAQLSELERRFLVAACGSAFSFLAVEAVERGKGMQLRDLLTGETHDVQEKLGSETASRDSVLFARVVSLDGVSILLGCAPVVLPAKQQVHILDFREALAGEGGMLTPEQLAELDFQIRERYFEILVDLYHPAPPVLQNTDGELLAPCKSSFELGCSPAEAFAALRELAAGESEEEILAEAQRDAAGALRSLRFSWLRRRNAKHASCESTLLGTLAIDGAKLTAEVNSEERAERIRAEIEARLGSRVRFERKRVQSLEELLAAGRARGPSASDREREEESRRLMELPEVRRFLEQRWEAWLDEPIPALGGERPRQAAASERGRERLEALLAGYAEGASRPGDAFATPDVGLLREKLGLPPRPAPRRPIRSAKE